MGNYRKKINMYSNMTLPHYATLEKTTHAYIYYHVAQTNI